MIDKLNAIVLLVGSAMGIFGGVSGIISLYKAKPAKTALEIENFKKLLDEAQEERQTLKQEHNEYVKNTEDRMNILNKKIESMDERNTRKVRAINSAYRCSLIKSPQDCIVLKTLDGECKDNENDKCKTK